MKFYVINNRWPLYYKKDDQFIPLGDFDTKFRDESTHKVYKELNSSEAIEYIKDSNGYQREHTCRKIANDFVSKYLFYDELLEETKT